MNIARSTVYITQGQEKITICCGESNQTDTTGEEIYIPREDRARLCLEINKGKRSDLVSI